MTYQEAIELKKSTGETKRYKGADFEVIITPSLNSDLVKYLAEYRKGGFEDATAKNYSTNQEYCVYALNGIEDDIETIKLG